ncbi:ABC transporter ATP-binding protein [Nonomuraea soli]
MRLPAGRGGPRLTLVRQVLGSRPRLLWALAGWSVVEALPMAALGIVLAHAIDDGFAAGEPVTGLLWLGALGAAWVVGAVGARQVVVTIAGLVEPFREALLSRVVAGVLHRADGDTAALARTNLQVELARDALAAVITVLRSFVFSLAGVIIGLAALVPELVVLILPPVVAGLALFAASLPALARRHRAFLLADEATAESVTAMAAGLRDVSAAGAEERIGDQVVARVDAQARAGTRLAGLTGARTLTLAVGGWLPVVIVLASAPSLGAGPGVVLGALTYVTQSLVPALSNLFEGLGANGVRLGVSLGRVLESAPVPPPRSVLEGGRSGGARLRGVRFAYGPHAEPVLDGLDLDLAEGEHLAVVGPSGIGKSTLASLLAGLLSPDAGWVLVGGIRADLIDPVNRVLVPQEAYVFRGTLLENLMYLGCGEIMAAVRAVGAEDLVARLGGLEADVDPALLSPAERQLITLVRAYLSPARLVILDEATCHLDAAAEARAEEAFARRGGTLVVIAHRISSAVRARRVLVMDGTGVMLGTHEDLLDRSPLYADLVGHWRIA